MKNIDFTCMKITTIGFASSFNNKIILENADSAYFTHFVGFCVSNLITIKDFINLVNY